MTRSLRAIALMLAVAAPALAHHSFDAEYDIKKVATLSGFVTQIDWQNPHAFVYLDVKDDKGNVVNWEIEMMSLNHLRSYGWMRTTIKSGDIITCTGGRAKSGAASMISALMKLPDGREIRS